MYVVILQMWGELLSHLRIHCFPFGIVTTATEQNECKLKSR